MKIQYFGDTDTLYLVLNDAPVLETRELDENTLVDVDAKGSLVSITIEHAAERVDVTRFSYEQIAAPYVRHSPSLTVKE
jgi:uncharacterized protein YuzE